MALAKERSILPHDPCMIMTSVLSSQTPYNLDHQDIHKPAFDQEKSSSSTTSSCGKNFAVNGQSYETTFRAANNQAEDAQSVINFTGFVTHSSDDQSLLSFDQQIIGHRTLNHKEEYYSATNPDPNYTWSNHNPRFSSDFNCFQTASDRGIQHGGDGSYGWLYSEATVVADSFEESEAQESAGFHKRPHVVINKLTNFYSCLI